MSFARILIVDDEEAMCLTMTQILKTTPGYESVAVQTGEDALKQLQHQHFDLVVTDLRLPGIDGGELIDAARNVNPNLPVIVVTSHGTIDSAVELIRKGAFHYITKPIKATDFLFQVDRALETLGLRRELQLLKSRFSRVDGIRQIIGNSQAIHKVLEILPAIARNDASAVIYGESGTGKELVAKAIHALSSRREGPFVTLNCGALPETLLENELFGHVKGAYSDAVTDRHGLAHEADQGSLFLDEIGEIGLPIQVKLLRFLQEHEYRPLGSTRTYKSNVRIISATNRDLKQAIKEGSFRDDLYYRLNIIPIHLPSLRDRREDIPILANHFLHKYASEYDKKYEGFTPEAFQKMMNYSWPGNIRELENKIQQILVISPPGPIRPDQISFDEFQDRAEERDRTGGDMFSFDEAALSLPFGQAKASLIEAFEKQYLTAALAANGGNVSAAARKAGKDRRAFLELMKKRVIDPKPFRKSRIRDSSGNPAEEDRE